MVQMLVGFAVALMVSGVAVCLQLRAIPVWQFWGVLVGFSALGECLLAAWVGVEADVSLDWFWALYGSFLVVMVAAFLTLLLLSLAGPSRGRD